jgi:Kdo2-lipid IVA lauroyltransferase/acyltransferase
MNNLVYLLFKFLEKVVPLFPLSFIRFIAKLKGKLFYYILPIRKKTAYKNLKLAFPEKSDKEIRQIIKGCYINVITVIAEFFYFPKLNKEKLNKLIKFEKPEIFAEKLKKGKGLVIISAHIGNWELMAFGGSQLAGFPFNVIVKEQSNIKLDREINRVRELRGNKMIDMSRAMREVLSLLRQNKIIAMLGDQAAPRENVKVNFFIPGVPVFEGAARFAIKTQAQVLFGISFRNDDGNYFVRMIDIDMSKYKEYNDENIKLLTQEHTKILEDCIRQRPDHWLWFHKRFKNVEGLKLE